MSEGKIVTLSVSISTGNHKPEDKPGVVGGAVFLPTQ